MKLSKNENFFSAVNTDENMCKFAGVWDASEDCSSMKRQPTHDPHGWDGEQGDAIDVGKLVGDAVF